MSVIVLGVLGASVARVLTATDGADDHLAGESTAGAPGPQPVAPGPPVPMEPDTSYTQVTVTRGEELRVEQWIESSDFMLGVTLGMPNDSLLPAGAVRASDIRVFADGSAVAGPTQLDQGSASYSYPGAQRVYLTYRLQGVLERSSTQPGRALARITSLDVSHQPQSRSSTVAFVDAALLNLACEQEYVDIPPVPCGVRTSDGWKVDLPAGGQGYRVMAQLDLQPAVL